MSLPFFKDLESLFGKLDLTLIIKTDFLLQLRFTEFLGFMDLISQTPCLLNLLLHLALLSGKQLDPTLNHVVLLL